MRKIGLQFLLFLPLTAFGQSISYLENTVLYSNPAARVKEKFFSTNTINSDAILINGNFKNLTFNGFTYNKLEVKNFQFGLGMVSYLNQHFKSGNLKLDANYSFKLAENLSLSVGLGASFNQYGYFKYQYSPNLITTKSNVFVGLNSGLMLEGKKWRTGFSVNNFNEPDIRIFNDTMMVNYSFGFFAEYIFRLNENWGIIPLINYGINNQLNTVLGISATYKKLQFGTSMLGNGFTVFAGYTFNDKFMMSAITKIENSHLSNGYGYGNTMLNFSFQVPKIKKEKGEKL